jgi:TetR/AcrR family transcriptional repressor of nem operon
VAKLGREEILDLATDEFWSHGYRAASMDGLVRAIGTTRARLYGEFGDKQGLFQAVLDRYAQRIVTEALRPLDDPDAGLAGIDRYFRDLVVAVPGEQLLRGCLMTTTMAEVGEDLPQITARVRTHLDRVTAALLAALNRARDRGELAEPIADLHTTAVGLATLAQGVWTCARAGVDAGVLITGVTALTDALRPPARPRTSRPVGTQQL